jgi:saccharopine dehydrogenase-like NADP-dependent oxidoreductase
MKEVLILGAGLVAKPMVGYLLDRGFELMIASPMKDRAEDMIGKNPLGSAIDWSMDDKATLDRLISEYKVVVSLLPYKYHTDVAKVCLAHGKSLVTTSYVQPSMLELDEEARKKGILLLNEIGLDPGIDHMSAMKIIDHIHSQGGSVESFYSLCGALPAPEAADNPLKYKFSWSPKGVVLASMNSALYLRDGKRVFIETSGLFRDRFTYNFPGIGNLEVYPNRDSISYAGIYGIPEVRSMYRGTFRYKGWCETLDIFKSLGMLDDKPGDYAGMSYSHFLASCAGIENVNLKSSIAKKLGLSENSPPVASLDYLGFFSDEITGYTITSPFEITSGRMIGRMLLSDDERDMVVMQHVFLASYPSGKREVIKSSILDFGTPATNTSIARTVALPAAIAVKMILSKSLELTGVRRPVVPAIYIPVLEELKNLGIEMKEEYGLPASEMLVH